MSIIYNFIKGLGYEKFATGINYIYADNIGRFHLVIRNNHHKRIDLELEPCGGPHEISFTPISGRKVTSEDVEFLEALRGVDTSKLVEGIKEENRKIYEAVRKYAYEQYKREYEEFDWKSRESGNVLYCVHTRDYMSTDAYDDLDVDYSEVIGSLKEKRDEKAIGEGILSVWKEKTGREDLYVEYRGVDDMIFIMSK